jgi:hypothetical protein
LKLRQERIVVGVALALIAMSVPFAIMDTLQTGRVHLFSRQFFQELPRRFTGPGRLRFILQPLVAIILGIRGGLADARAGRQPYQFALIFGTEKRKELLRNGAAAITTLVAMGIILDIMFQLALYQSVHPGAALVIGPVLIGVPYAVSRAVTTRLARHRSENRHPTFLEAGHGAAKRRP